MAKSVAFKSNSIVYFKGDTSDKVYLLKAGKISLKYNDIETGQELYDLIQTGEFFGVKSALGKYPREETAIVLQDSDTIVFTVPEFEQVVLNNTRIIMKMLKVFSNQLRRIHKQVRDLISNDEQAENHEAGLFNIGEYYLKSKRYSQALHAFRRYLTYYPSGVFAQQALLNSEAAERFAKASGAGGAPGRMAATASMAAAAAGPSAQGAAVSPSAQGGGGVAVATAPGGGDGAGSDVAQRYYNAVSLFSQQKFSEALSEFKEIISAGQDEEYVAKAIFEVGRCLFSLEDYEQCTAHFTTMIQRYPKHPDIIEALYYVGSCYEAKNEVEKAKGFYKKIIAMAPEDAPVSRKARKAIRGLEGR